MTGWRLACAGVLLLPGLAFGHARLVSPPPRTTTIGKTPPCAGAPRTSTPTVLTAGQILQVDWVEIVDHPGHYELAISLANDQNFTTLPGMGNIPDRPFEPGATQNDYSTLIQVPSTPCDACTLQLIQFMSDHAPGSQYYYSCTDIRIVAAPTTTTTTTIAGGTSTTTTIPPPDCSGLVAYDAASCQIQRALAQPVCGPGMDARFSALLDAGLTTVLATLDRAVDAATPARRAHRLVLAAGRRLRRMQGRTVVAGKRRRIDGNCETVVSDMLAGVQAALAAIAP